MANLQKIKELAETRKISIRDLADRVGVKENQIHVMCRTNSTKIDTLEKIAHELDVPAAYFFDEADTGTRTAGRDYVERGNIEHNGTEYNAPLSPVKSELEQENAELKRKLIAMQEKVIELMGAKQER